LLLDADGVLLQWNRGFCAWAAQRGIKEICTTEYNLTKRLGLSGPEVSKLVHEFNCSAAVSYLFPIPGSVIVVNKLRELGYEPHVITAFGGDVYSQIQRQRLLHDYFRVKSENVHFLGMDGNKRALLSRWKDSGAPWVEDKVENAFDGHALGLNAILLRSDHTMDYISDKIFVADTWYNIFEHITGEEKCRTSGSLSTC
jgi:hypothetical protein